MKPLVYKKTRKAARTKPVPVFVTVSLAPLITAPEGSVTVPFSDAPPTSDWAKAKELRKIAINSLPQRFMTNRIRLGGSVL